MSGDKATFDPRQKMLHTNVRQKAFYESRFEDAQAGKLFKEQASNLPTNIWSWMRERAKKFRNSSGLEEEMYALHRKWMGNQKDARVLDLGCFSGNRLSLWIAEHCAEYIGIDLSEQATACLDAKLRERGLTHAHAYAQDFLANSYSDNHFDLVYAFSVLHHFKDKAVLLEELYRVLKPGGEVISVDPLMTEWFNRLARTIYRSVQTDRDWEWPFTYSTFRLLKNYFEIMDMQGYMGMAKLGLPFDLVPGLGGLGRAIGNWGLQFDRKHTRKPGWPFYFCWMATLRLRKTDRNE